MNRWEVEAHRKPFLTQAYDSIGELLKAHEVGMFSSKKIGIQKTCAPAIETRTKIMKCFLIEC